MRKSITWKEAEEILEGFENREIRWHRTYSDGQVVLYKAIVESWLRTNQAIKITTRICQCFKGSSWVAGNIGNKVEFREYTAPLLIQGEKNSPDQITFNGANVKAGFEFQATVRTMQILPTHNPKAATVPRMPTTGS